MNLALIGAENVATLWQQMLISILCLFLFLHSHDVLFWLGYKQWAVLESLTGITGSGKEEY